MLADRTDNVDPGSVADIAVDVVVTARRQWLRAIESADGNEQAIDDLRLAYRRAQLDLLDRVSPKKEK